jgi:hypothetical protein
MKIVGLSLLGELKLNKQFAHNQQTSGQKLPAFDGQASNAGRSQLGTCSHATSSTSICSKWCKGDRRCERHHWRHQEESLAGMEMEEAVCCAPSHCGLTFAWRVVSSHSKARTRQDLHLQQGNLWPCCLVQIWLPTKQLAGNGAWGANQVAISSHLSHGTLFVLSPINVKSVKGQ